MSYLYHVVPDNFKGDYILPLSNLKKEYASQYRRVIKKYKGREWQCTEKVFYLNCLWEDCINLMAVDPEKIKLLLKKAGSKRNMKNYKFFKIPIEKLNKNKLIMFIYPKTSEENYTKKLYKKLNKQRIKESTKIPKGLFNYYKKCYGEGKIPLTFHLINHVLYKGKIPIKDLEIV